MKHRFNKKALMMLISTIEMHTNGNCFSWKMVGVIAAQSIGEPKLK